jgi:TPR repeat protein
MQYRRFISVVFLALIPTFVGCRSTAPGITPAQHSESAAEQSDQCRIAVRHYEAEDIPSGEILKGFEQLAQNNDARGTMWIARLYLLGRCSLPKRPDLAQNMAKEAIPEVIRLAENGDPEAQFLVGFSYQVSLAVDLDLQKAVNWYTKSVGGGQITAMNNLAVMLALGHGTEPDIDRARLLFTRAAELGSRGASTNLSIYGDDSRDDTARLHALRTVTLVQTLGMHKDEGIAFLARSGLISDPKGSNERDYRGRKQYHFRADGIVVGVDANGRIMSVEGHAKGSRSSDQFRGEIPLGVTWNTTLKSALQTLDTPDDRGYVQSDEAYGLAYRIENLTFSLMFSYEGEYKLKVWRVHENWATKYSSLQQPEHDK